MCEAPLSSGARCLTSGQFKSGGQHSSPDLGGEAERVQWGGHSDGVCVSLSPRLMSRVAEREKYSRNPIVSPLQMATQEERKT